MNQYKIKYSAKKPVLSADWNSADWSNAEVVTLEQIRPESNEFAPIIKVKLLYNRQGIAGIFSVENEYVCCRHMMNMESVWKDSCVEFFVKPPLQAGYFNFEFNCIARLYASYISNPERTEGGFKDFVLFKSEDCSKVEVVSSLRRSIYKDGKEPVNWNLQFFIPFLLMEQFAGKLDLENNYDWSCNFYKCADESSYPHWISWSPVKELNFHEPESFGKLLFDNI